jgi:hypothetical protein
MSSKNLSPESLADDTIWGVGGKNGIAATIGRTPQQTYYLISRGRLPVRKIGHRTIIASREKLRRHLAGDAVDTDDAATS